MLFIDAGNQVPSIPLFEVVGNADNKAPEQIAATWVKEGVIGWSTVIVADPEAIQPFASVPVTEYVVVDVGDTTILFVVAEVPHTYELAPVAVKVALAPEHTFATEDVALTVGKAFTTICIVAVLAHEPAAGVNV